MNNSLDIKILNPCQKKWEEMKNIENGDKFCDSCIKKVYNFIDTPKDKIKAIYDENKWNICGIFSEARELNYSENKFYRKLATFALSLMLTFGTSLFTFGNSSSYYLNNFNEKTRIGDTTQTFIIKGKINKTVSGDSVEFFYKNTLITKVKLNKDSSFEIELPMVYNKEKLNVKVSNSIFNYRKKVKIKKNRFLNIKFKDKHRTNFFIGCPSF